MNTTNREDQHSYNNAYYRIAGHLVAIQFPSVIDRNRCLPNFVPFETGISLEETPTMEFRLTFSDVDQYPVQTKLLSDLSIVWGDHFRFEESEQNYITRVRNNSDQCEWQMFSTKDFQNSTIYMLESEIYDSTILSWLLMVAFGQAILPFDTLMIHSSVVERSGEAYAFLGKSGTGKSTHSQLWLQHLTGFKLLNDDNPAIRILNENQIMVYGTPWSGKTPCYRNIEVELKGIIRLNQAPDNNYVQKTGIGAFITLLPSCSSIRWNRQLFTHMNNTVQRIVQLLPIGTLNCLPNAEAAHLAYAEIRKETIITLNKIENE